MAFKINATLHKETGLIPEGLYCAEVAEEPELKEKPNGKDQVEWTFKLVMAEPGNEAHVGRTIKNWSSNYIGTDSNTGEPKDFTWPTINVVKALGVSVKSGQVNNMNVPFTKKKCGIVIVHKESSDGKPRANVQAVMDLKTFQKEMAQKRNEAEYLASLGTSTVVTESDDSSAVDDVSSDDI